MWMVSRLPRRIRGRGRAPDVRRRRNLPGTPGLVDRGSARRDAEPNEDGPADGRQARISPPGGPGQFGGGLMPHAHWMDPPKRSPGDLLAEMAREERNRAD